MGSPKTKVFLTDADGNTVINDFLDSNCLRCIFESQKEGKRYSICPIDSIKRHVFFSSDKIGKIYVCDEKEKTSKNFQTLVGLINHSRASLIRRHTELATEIQRAAFRELDALEHNIVHINADAINEFYSFITQDTLVTNYWKLQDLISENIDSHKEDAIELIAKLARYNLSIKTELSVVSKLNNPDGKPSFNIGKPRDAIMSSVYMLYPMFKRKKVYVNVGECWDRFEIDYDALQVASFYIIENATKYTEKNSQVSIVFTRSQHQFTIDFNMRSLYVEPTEVPLIFDEGFRGNQAVRTKKGGKGIGLYRAKRLAHFIEGDLYFEAGTEAITGKDGLDYADNKFSLVIPVRMPIK